MLTSIHVVIAAGCYRFVGYFFDLASHLSIQTRSMLLLQEKEWDKLIQSFPGGNTFV